MSLLARRKMVEQDHIISLVSQCNLLGLHRSSLYYQPVAVASEDLALMGLLDKQYLKTPFYGYRKMTKFLQGQGYQVNHKRVRRLMQLMGLEAIYCQSPVPYIPAKQGPSDLPLFVKMFSHHKS